MGKKYYIVLADALPEIFIKVAECLQSEYIYVPKISLADGILASVYYDYKEKGIVKMFDDYSDDEM